jgi:hypothetical protein
VQQREGVIKVAERINEEGVAAGVDGLAFGSSSSSSVAAAA